MREIRFRGKSIANQCWYFGDLRQFEDDCAYIFEKSRLLFVDPDTVGQFTGLKDIDGVEIYEGDILQNDEHPEIIGLVIFQGGCFCAKYHDDDKELDTLSWVLSAQKVIGNIHNNPELLEVQNNDDY